MSFKKFQEGGFVDEADLFSDDDAGQGDGGQQTGSPLDSERVDEQDLIPDTGGTQDAGGAGDGDGTGGEPGEDPVTLDGVELFLSDYGVKGGIIEYADGTTANFHELPPEEQHEVLSSLTRESVPTIEQKYDLDEEEIELLNIIRENGGDVSEFINNLVDNRVNKLAEADALTTINFNEIPADDMFIIHLKDKHPDFSDEEIASELSKAKEMSTYDETIEAIRDSYISKQNELISELDQEERAAFMAELEAQKHEIVQTVEDIDDIAGASITDEMKEYLLHDIMELNENNDPILMEKIFSDPEAMFKVNWFLNYGEDYINKLNNYWKREVSKARKAGYQDSLSKMPSNPTIVTGSNMYRSNNTSNNSNNEPNYIFGQEVSEEELFE